MNATTDTINDNLCIIVWLVDGLVFCHVHKYGCPGAGLSSLPLLHSYQGGVPVQVSPLSHYSTLIRVVSRCKSLLSHYSTLIRMLSRCRSLLPQHSTLIRMVSWYKSLLSPFPSLPSLQSHHVRCVTSPLDSTVSKLNLRNRIVADRRHTVVHISNHKLE